MTSTRFFGACFFIFTLSFLTYSCTQHEMSAEEHKSYIENWHNDRLERLQARQGWLSLAGMEWIEEGKNTFGTASSNDVIFPQGSMPEMAGHLILENGSVRIYPDDGVEFTIGDTKVERGIEIFGPEIEALVLTIGQTDWTIIQRSELIGVRIYDKESPYLTEFTGLERFPVDLDWRIKGEFVPNDEPTFISVVNVLGQLNQLETPGTVFFKVDDETYSIDVLPGTDSFFLIIGDESNKSATYGGGRYLYIDLPDRRGNVVLDFNKLYTPPCSMNPYSTCNLPPVQNRLALFIEAGEKRYRIPEAVSGTIQTSF